jgi:hypothetical protein
MSLSVPIDAHRGRPALAAERCAPFPVGRYAEVTAEVLAA